MKKITKIPNSLSKDEKKQVETFLEQYLVTEQQISSISIFSLMSSKFHNSVLIILKDKNLIKGIFAVKGNVVCYVGDDNVFADNCHNISFITSNSLIRLTENQYNHYKKNLGKLESIKVNYHYLDKKNFTPIDKCKDSNIRFAKKRDIKLLNNFYNRDYSYRKDCIDEDYWTIMIKDKRIVSAARINDKYDNYAVIGAVKTAFLHLNKGYSTLVISRLTEALLEDKFEHITLESLAINPPAIRVYEKVGFSIKSQHYLIEKKPNYLKKYREEIMETASWKHF